jgi:hypothetical protein
MWACCTQVARKVARRRFLVWNSVFATHSLKYMESQTTKPQPQKTYVLIYAWSLIRYHLVLACVFRIKCQRNKSSFSFFGNIFLRLVSSAALQTYSSSIGNNLISRKPQLLKARILIVTRCTVSCGLMK